MLINNNKIDEEPCIPLPFVGNSVCLRFTIRCGLSVWMTVSGGLTIVAVAAAFLMETRCASITKIYKWNWFFLIGNWILKENKLCWFNDSVRNNHLFLRRNNACSQNQMQWAPYLLVMPSNYRYFEAHER